MTLSRLSSDQKCLTALAAAWGASQLVGMSSQAVCSSSALGRTLGGAGEVADFAAACLAVGSLTIHHNDPQSESHSLLSCPRVYVAALLAAHWIGKCLANSGYSGCYTVVQQFEIYGIPTAILWSGFQEREVPSKEALLFASAFLIHSKLLPLTHREILSHALGFLAVGVTLIPMFQAQNPVNEAPVSSLPHHHQSGNRNRSNSL